MPASLYHATLRKYHLTFYPTATAIFYLSSSPTDFSRDAPIVTAGTHSSGRQLSVWSIVTMAIRKTQAHQLTRQPRAAIVRRWRPSPLPLSYIPDHHRPSTLSVVPLRMFSPFVPFPSPPRVNPRQWRGRCNPNEFSFSEMAVEPLGE